MLSQQHQTFFQTYQISLTSVVNQCTSLQQTQPTMLPSFNDVAALQNCADTEEKIVWVCKSCTQNAGLWLHPDGRPVCPRSLLHVHTQSRKCRKSVDK